MDALPPVGLGDLVDVAAALDLDGPRLALAAELLGLRPPVAPAVAPPRRRVPAPPVPRRSASSGTHTALRAPAVVDDPGPALPVAVTTIPAAPTALPLARRSLAELLPTAGGPAPVAEGLLRPGTRRALLRGIAATRERDGDIDLDEVVGLLAGNHVFDTLPLEWVDSVRGELILLLDGGAAMDPFRADVDRFPDELTHVLGPVGLKVRWFEDCPAGAVLTPGELKPHRFALPGARSRLLVVTAFGARGSAGSPTELAVRWRRFAARCVRRRVPLRILTPLPPALRPRGLAAVTWDRATSVRDVRR
jgi:hypothetical protein